MIENNIELYQNIFNNLEDAVFIIDKNGKTLLANNATLKLYDCTKEEFDKYYSSTHYLLKNGILDKCSFEQSLSNQAPASSLINIYNKKGTAQTYYTKQTPVFDANGDVKYIVGWCRSANEINKNVQMLHDTQPLAAKMPQGGFDQGRGQFIYESQKMQNLVALLDRISPTNATVMLQGETGTGKEVIANYIHQHSQYADRNMVAINCAAISPSLFESELFGYTKGSFTGASTTGKVGLIETADHSTLFLDEIDSLPFEFQGKLLRVLETKTVQRIGASQPKPINFRLIVASNKNLQALVREGKLRSDLYYRFNVVTINIPPLRDRFEDIRPLANYYLQRYCLQYGNQKEFSDTAFEQLENYLWPGNIRELKNVIEQTLLTSDLSSHVINNIPYLHGSSHDFLTQTIAPNPNTMPGIEPASIQSLEEYLNDQERLLLASVIRSSNSRTEAAAKLKISLSTLERRIRKYGLF